MLYINTDTTCRNDDCTVTVHIGVAMSQNVTLIGDITHARFLHDEQSGYIKNIVNMLVWLSNCGFAHQSWFEYRNSVCILIPSYGLNLTCPQGRNWTSEYKWWMDLGLLGEEGRGWKRLIRYRTTAVNKALFHSLHMQGVCFNYLDCLDWFCYRYQ